MKYPLPGSHDIVPGIVSLGKERKGGRERGLMEGGKEIAMHRVRRTESNNANIGGCQKNNTVPACMHTNTATLSHDAHTLAHAHRAP